MAGPEALRRWFVALGTLVLAFSLMACGESDGTSAPQGNSEGSASQRASGEPKVTNAVSVYIEHGPDIPTTFSRLAAEMDGDRKDDKAPRKSLMTDRATTMSVDSARTCISEGTLVLRWAIPPGATNASGVVWTIPLKPAE